MAKKIQRAAPVAAAKTDFRERGAPQSSGASGGERKRYRGRVASQTITDFTTQLATLTDAGIPIVKALTILEGQTRPGPFKTILGDLVEDVSAGTPLSESLGKHERSFDRLYCSMVRAGEAGGVLGRILTRLAAFREKSAGVRAKVTQALIYPAVVSLVAIGVVTTMIIVVVPKFEEIFREFGGELPKVTQVLLDTSRFAADYWYLVLGLPIVVALVHLMLMRRSYGYRFAVHKLMLRVPWVGVVLSKSLISAFARTFGTLIEAGVPHLDALSIVRDSTGNEVLAKGVDEIRTTVREGEGIARPMGESGVFDDLVVNMVDVGEATGELDKMLIKVADAYDVQVDRRTQAMLTILEPMLIIIMAAIVGFIVVALFMPLLDIMSKLGEA
ncbi:MAG: type II secretion system F family protein [Planctomycetes bacterium]|nr:type II secretion system F family protein [Planctomycetota bacterium]